MSNLYTTKVAVVGGRNGIARSDDGLLELQLAPPPEMGGRGGATNAEQLFAAGYAACFGSAMMYAARQKAIKIKDDDIEVVAEVGIGPTESGGFTLSIALDVRVAGCDYATAEEIVRAAHEVCPYSNAVKGNIDVQLTTIGSP